MVKITVEVEVDAGIEEVWDAWNSAVTEWYFASDDWECSSAENDLRVGGEFRFTLAPKGGEGFDLVGTYTKIVPMDTIKYTIEDGREVVVKFIVNDKVKVVEIFEAEEENNLEMQRDGWQAILDNFRDYVESSKKA